MAHNSLPETEIKQRLIRLRNLEKLHAKDQQTKEQLKRENRELREKLDALTVKFEMVIEAQTIRIAELERMVFGKKKNKDKTSPYNKDSSDDSADSEAGTNSGSDSSKTSRSADSYRRPAPPDEAVTNEEHHEVTKCGHCHGELTDIAEYVRYVEDIVIAALDAAARTKTVTKLTIQRGYCVSCGKYTSARDLRGQEVTLGSNVRLLIGYLTTILDMTYSQVKDLLFDLYHFDIAEGEIAAVLVKAGYDLTPEYEAIKTRIRSGPAAHLDESQYHIQEEDNSGYGWVMAAALTGDVIFKLADSRGKAHAEELLGKGYKGVRITDGYASYKNLPGSHQQCWVHLYRIIRDLNEVSTLPENKRAHVSAHFKEFKGIYDTLRKYLSQPHDELIRGQQVVELTERIRAFCKPDGQDPKKLANLKIFLTDYEHALFTCLVIPGVPADNNKAERVIRKLVLKRKKSFNCKTNVGAKATEVLMSVFWSTRYNQPNNLFSALAALTTA